jgi:AcrR family transcriptional regulator
VEQAPNKFVADPAARVTAPALRRRRPGSTAQGRRARDRVLQASVDLITEAGIDQVRLATVAQRAGMSTGQVMYYFTSKEHILLEALAWREHEDTRRRRASLRKIDGAWRQLGRFVDLYLPTSPVDPSWLLWIEAWARAPHNADVSRFLDELMVPWREDLAQIVERGAQRGVFEPPDAIGDFTIRFCALLDGLGIFHLRQMPSLPRHRVTGLAMDAARAELTVATRAPSPSSAAHTQGEGIVS